MSGDPTPEIWEGRPVTVTGGAGFLGSHLVHSLEALGSDVTVVRSAEHDLRDPAQAAAALAGSRMVFHLAATVGGIGFNRRNPGPLAHDNLLIGVNVFEQARIAGVEKLVCACSVCAYPHDTPVPFSEDDLWSGFPEGSNAPYGVAKRTLLVLADGYRRQYGFDSCAPVIANLYGPGDNYDLEDSHVIAALVRKYHEAVERGDDEVVLWGTGEPTREFLHAADAARALLLAAERLDDSEPVNVGTGKETRIQDLASIIAAIAGFEGETVWDESKPDGQAARYLDVTRARDRMGFEARIGLEEGLAETVAAYRAQVGAG